MRLKLYTNYEEARDKIDFGIFVSTHRRGFMSSVIRFFTTIFRHKVAHFSHTGFILKERIEGLDEERVVVYEADWKTNRFNKIPASQRFAYDDLEYEIYTIEDIAPQFRKAIASKLFFMWGIKYDKFGAIVAPFYDSETKSAVFCSESVRSLMEWANVGLLPQDIREYLHGIWLDGTKSLTVD